MSQKNLNTRMISKHDTQAKWENVSDFIPYKGEIIVYDRDDNYSYERFKIGDGVTTINELSFAAIQPDWSQNDETAADYVKNRTHWVEEGYAEIMPETTIVATDEGRLCITEPFLTPLADGQEYTVSYNGVEYKTTALEVVEDGITVILLGDYGLIMGGTSTGEPFIIVVYPDGLDSIYGEVMDIGGAASVTIKIILDGTITHRLDQKYLPEHIYSAEKVSGVVLPETTVTADATAFLINVAPVNQPILGVNHTVIWNGVSYDCVAVKDDTSSEVIACMLGDLVTTPFSIGVLNSQGIVQSGSYFYVVCNDGKGEKTISININGEKIRTIDMKFLPEELFTKIDSSNLKNGNTEGSLRTIGSNKESDDYALGKHALSTGQHTSAKGEAAHAEGGWTEANGDDSHAEGHSTIANGENSHAEGERANANGRGSHAEGWNSISTGMSSHAEGYHSESEGIYAHAEGYNSIAKGRAAHTEGQLTIAYGISSHAEGLGTYSDSAYSHVIGSYNLRDKKFDGDYISVKTENIEKTFNRLHSYSVINNNVHPTKFTTISYGDQNHFGYSVSFGQSIDDRYSTSLSWANLQPGNLFSSDISGENWATYYYEVVEILTITDTEITLKLNEYECISRSYEKAKYVHIVGNGESDKERSNAHTLDWSGNAWYAGDVYVGGTSQDDENAKMLVSVDKNPEANLHLTTDAEGNTVWEEKLAYEKTEEVVILPETTVEWEYPDSPEALLTTPFQKRMEGGHEYTVMWNGQPHKCAAQEVDDGEGGVAVTVEAEGYFMIIQLPEQATASYGAYALVHRQDEITSATFSITAATKVIKTIDPKYLASNNGIHKQLVTDKNGEAVWEDRTHYAYQGEVVAFEGTALVPNEDGQIIITTPLAVMLEDGKTYNVTWNGTDYECPASKFESDGVTAVCIGNLGAVTGTGDTGEPFLLLALPPSVAETAGMYAGIYVLDGSASITVKISFAGEAVKRIDYKYLPEYIYGIEDVPTNTVLNQTTFMFDGTEADEANITEAFASDLVIGAAYDVYWNGTKYAVTAADLDGVGVCVGNLYRVGASSIDTGEPFAIVQFGDAAAADYGAPGLVGAYDGSVSVTVSVTTRGQIIHKVPEQFLPEVEALNLVNGRANGSLRSVNAKDNGSQMGENAVAIGLQAEAIGPGSFALGDYAKAGSLDVANTPQGDSIAIGNRASAKQSSVAIGNDSVGEYGGFAIQGNTASGANAFAAGYCTKAQAGQFVFGAWNVVDKSNKYIHIVGNGTGYDISGTVENRSNAHTLDWNGNAWFQGNVYVGGTNQDEGSEKLLTQSEVNSIINELLAAILPTPTVEDAGKVLRVNEEGKYELVAPLTNEEIDDICGSTVQVSSEMVDEATGESYRLYVSNGELKMEKVV